MTAPADEARLPSCGSVWLHISDHHEHLTTRASRVLHVLALGGHIDHARCGTKTREVCCITRDGLILADCTLPVFQCLRRKRLIASEGGGPYRISRLGRLSVRAQHDNQG
jgi:uncharacterized protein